jgi:hypothetical protein
MDILAISKIASSTIDEIRRMGLKDIDSKKIRGKQIRFSFAMS